MDMSDSVDGLYEEGHYDEEEEDEEDGQQWKNWPKHRSDLRDRS